MQLMFRLPHVMGVLLLAAAPFAGAESPLPDPIAPAVIGRPLDQIRPARAAHHKLAAAKPKPHKQVVAASKSVRPHRKAVALATQAVAAPPKPHTQVLGNTGTTARVVARTLGPGTYFSSNDQELVRTYYAAHPVSGLVEQWKIGEPIPPKSQLTGVPDDLRASLSPLPVGHQYVQVDGDVVLVAVQSRVVVDGISRGVR